MKREDFAEDDLQGMLIAYLDEQMEFAEKAAFEKLLSQHEDLRADLELYKKTSSNLEGLFELDGAETPAHIMAEFYQRQYDSTPISPVQPLKKLELENYTPGEDEPFMNELQAEYFRRKLLDWKKDLISDSEYTVEGLQDETRRFPDSSDTASEEKRLALELRTRDRQRKLVSKIDAALRRIDEGEYGYCEVTGEPISLKRLDARPIATMSLEAQQRQEMRHFLKAQSPLPQVSVPTTKLQPEMNSNETDGLEFSLAPKQSNVTSFTSRTNTVQRFFSLQGLTQMAAALALGIFLGPGILDQFSEAPSTSNKQPANFKINTDELLKIEEGKLQSLKSPVTQSLVDERRISELETGFTILVNGQKFEASSDKNFTQGDQYQFTFKSPESGQLRILKTDINGSSKTSEIVLDSLVKRGENIIVPAQGFLTIGDITNFQLKATLTILEGNEINYTRIFTVN